MTYNIISSGSKGNAVIVNDYIMIDCGVPFKQIEPFYKRLSAVCLTHIHGDHFKKSTIKKLAAERPTLKWICGAWLVAELVALNVPHSNIEVLQLGKKMNFGLFSLTAYSTPHNVPNCCYIFDLPGKLFYATDCNSLSHIECKGAELYMVEGNYKEKDVAEKIAQADADGEYTYLKQVIKNHLSEEKALAWLADNMGEKSNYILMHKHEEREKK